MSWPPQTTPTCADNPVDRALIGLKDFDRHAEKLAKQSAALFVSDEARLPSWTSSSTRS